MVCVVVLFIFQFKRRNLRVSDSQTLYEEYGIYYITLLFIAWTAYVIKLTWRPSSP